jgi:hypothetical protein
MDSLLFLLLVGKRKALEDQKEKSRNGYRKSKVVESSVVEKENDSV